jgi:WD40 repeat protein
MAQTLKYTHKDTHSIATLPSPHSQNKQTNRRTPDGRGVLLVAEFCVRAAVWDLSTRRCVHLPGPKHAARGLAFSPDGRSLAVIEVCVCVGGGAEFCAF